MKKMSFTLFKPGGWFSLIGKSAFLVLFAWCMVGQVSAQTVLTLDNDTRANDRYCDHTGNTFTECGATYTSNPEGESLYPQSLVDAIPGLGTANDYGNDPWEPIFWTFCPDDMVNEKVRLTFSKFDISPEDNINNATGAAGADGIPDDMFLVYDGDCSLANGDVDENPDVLNGLDDNNSLADGAGNRPYKIITGSSPGSMTELTGNAISGTGIAEFGAGWVEASCTNPSGCVTIGFRPDGDGYKGAGFEFTVSCEDRGAAITCPDDGDQDGDDATLFGGGHINGGCNATMLNIPAPQLLGCADNNNTPAGTLLSPPYYIQVLVDGVSRGFVNAGTTPFVFGDNNAATLTAGATVVTLNAGLHTVTYRLFFDKNEDGDGDPTDGSAEQVDAVDCEFTILDDQDLVCNDNVNISLGNDCKTIIDLDDLTENLNNVANANLNRYRLTIDKITGTYVSNGDGQFIRDNNGNNAIDATETTVLKLEEGEYKYILRDDCGNACQGEISLSDLQGPTCPGPSIQNVFCADLADAEAPDFRDCSGVEEGSESYDETTLGDDCGEFTAADFALLNDVADLNLSAAALTYLQTGGANGGPVVLTGSGSDSGAAALALTAAEENLAMAGSTQATATAAAQAELDAFTPALTTEEKNGVIQNLMFSGTTVTVNIGGTGMLNGVEVNADGSITLGTITIPAGATLGSIVIRRWKARDTNGFLTENCPQVFLNLRPNAISTEAAADGSRAMGDLELDDIEVSCDFEDTTPSGLAGGRDINGDRIAGYAPSYILGGSRRYILDGTSVCGWAVSYTDNPIEACGSSRKILRTWTVMDWCNPGNGTTTGTQLIVVTDNQAPELVEGPSIDTDTVSTAHFECDADVVLPTATFEDNCGEIAAYRTEIRERGADDDKSDIAGSAVLWRNNENGGTFANLKPGLYWALYFAVDECGNETATFTDGVDPITWDSTFANIHCISFVVADQVKPQPQCDDEIIVSLGSDWGRITAADIDEGSVDNCWIESIEVAIAPEGETPADEDFAEYQDIDCNEFDIHEPLYAHLKVTDESGNYNTCWSQITVEDKIKPICTPPADMTINCDELPHVLFESGVVPNGSALAAELDEEFGQFLCVDNLECGDLTPIQEIEVEEATCGRYTITRTYSASDWNGRNTSDEVTQTITVEYTPGWSLALPGDMNIECLIGEDQPDFTYHEDDITTTAGYCDQIGVEVEAKEFVAQDGACKKLEVTYHIINWCTYNPGDEPTVIERVEEDGEAIAQNISSDDYAEATYMTYTIVKKLVDNVAPEILDLVEPDSCIYTGTTENGCSESKTWKAWANDCVGDDDMDWDVKVYETDADGIVISEVTPTGTGYDGGFFTVTVDVTNKTYYVVEFWAFDGCGNSGGRKTEPRQFWDCKAPTPYALNGVAVSLMPTRMVEVWASDLDRNSEDNCSDVDLYIRSTKDSNGDLTTVEEVIALGTSVTFTCDDLGSNIVELYAVDAEGNFDFVSTYVIIQDNLNACEGSVETGQVAGTVLNADGEYVEDVAVSVNGNMASMSTTDDGQYRFTLVTGEDYTITPEKNVNPLNGVSTFDLVLISKHILGIAPFDTPYKYLAADVNKSGSVTAFDMVQLRQLILNITTEFPNNTSWRFVDATHDFGTTPLTENFNEFISINDLDGNMANVNFIAVKVGDVNGNAQPNSLVASDVRTAGTTLTLTTADQHVEAGQEVSVAFTADMEGVSGYQFTMDHAGLAFTQLGQGVATTENFNTTLRNAVATSWNGTATAGDVLFTLNFKATTAGNLSELLSLSSDVVAAEAYTATGEVMNVAINFTTSDAATFGLEQNTPNPFNGETVIGFTLPQAGQATLKVMDIQGKVLQSLTNDFAKGYNQISINAKTLGATGVLHYQLESADNVATKKMIIIE